MTTRIGVAVMTALFVLYVVFVGQRGYGLIVAGAQTGQVIPVVMGVVVFVIPIVAVWGIGRELRFGWWTSRLARRLEAENALPPERITTTPSGRPVREEAAALYPKYRGAVERDEGNWRTWFRLSLVYDASGDRRRARQAAREAIARARSSGDFRREAVRLPPQRHGDGLAR